MTNKFVKLLFILCVTTNYLGHSIEQKDDQSSSIDPLRPDQIEWSKQWWKSLGQQQKQGQPGQTGQKRRLKKKVKTYAGVAKVATRAKVVPSGDFQFMDSIVSTLFPIGDPYTGVPDGIFDLGRYCIDFVLQGIVFIAYTTIRWPHKIVLKTMLALGALSHLAANSQFCLNPIAMYHFVSKGKIVNEKMDELTENTNCWKKRLANSIDRSPLLKIQQHSCCAYWEWKRKSIEIVPKAAKNFVFMWFTAFYKIHEVVYCQMLSMKDFEKWCTDYEFDDREPVRVLPRSMITLCVELFAKFF